ncbi:TlpA family protein disulfide reductase [Bacteroidota bacterium]
MVKKRKIKRELIEWGGILAIFAFLYFTGLYKDVAGTLQGLILKTGIIKPDTEVNIEDTEIADYGFRVVDADGSIIDVSEWKGRVIFLNIWATWCPPCIAEMPGINKLYNDIHKEDIIFLMLSVDEDFQKAIDFVKRKEFDFPVYGLYSSVPAVYSGKVIPTTYVISPEGRIMIRKEGMADYDSESFRSFLRSML